MVTSTPNNPKENDMDTSNDIASNLSGVWKGGRELTNAEYAAEMDRIDQANTRIALYGEEDMSTTAETYTVSYTLRRVFNDPDTDEIQTEDVDLYSEPGFDSADHALKRIATNALTENAQEWLAQLAGDVALAEDYESPVEGVAPGSYYVVADVARHADGLWWEVATGEGDLVEWPA